ISGVGKSKPRTIDPRLDHEWQHVIDLVLVPNPNLPPERRRAVELEHRMVDGRRLVSCRLSMAFYLNAEHKLDVEPGVLDPLSQPLVLEDPDQIRKVREVVRALSIQALKRASDA
ncbi:MAG: WYL domain-containing protein, partial [Sphingomicrobium sp.]